MPTAVRSHAKINLGLGVGAPRADGFHALATVYQTLEMHDVVTVAARPAAATAIRLTSNDARVPTDECNTAWKMVDLALEALGRTAEVEIHIDKHLPVQGGLGAGSANAVAALVGLETELGIGGEVHGLAALASWPARSLGARSVSETRKTGRAGWDAQRLEIAAQVGSDVPLFLIGGTILGLDRGQEVYPLPDIEPVWCVVAAPDLGVSTAQAFRDWDALCVVEGLTAEASADKLSELSRAYASAFAGGFPQDGQGAGSSGVLANDEDRAGPQESALVRTGISSWIENDFERVVFRQHPSLAEIKRVLAAADQPGGPCLSPSLMASLSGSGSALFGLYLTRGDAEAAQVRLSNQVQGVKVQSTLTRTLPRSAYWGKMLLR
jgi:4-diphosphocytidyl-2-C-methyl-D-erythritol kinase